MHESGPLRRHHSIIRGLVRSTVVSDQRQTRQRKGDSGGNDRIGNGTLVWRRDDRTRRLSLHGRAHRRARSIARSAVIVCASGRCRTREDAQPMFHAKTSRRYVPKRSSVRLWLVSRCIHRSVTCLHVQSRKRCGARAQGRLSRQREPQRSRWIAQTIPRFGTEDWLGSTWRLDSLVDGSGRVGRFVAVTDRCHNK